MTRQLFKLPDLGEGLIEAELVKWLVAVGDTIAVDQPVAEVETAKSIVELPSPFAGTVAALHGTEGEVVRVGATLVEMADGSAGSAPTDAGTDAGPEGEAYREEERAGSGNVLIGYGTKESLTAGRSRKPRGSSSPARSAEPVETAAELKADNLVPEPAAEPPSAVPAAASGAAPHTGPVAVRSPIVRQLAHERGVDLHAITPTGPDGIITRDDVLRAATTASAAPTGDGVVRTEPLSMLRRTVAAKMSRSRTEIPEATVWVDADVTELWTLRSAMVDPAGSERPPSLMAIIAKYVTTALERYPVLAARLGADGTALEYLDGIHLGVATDTERGLMVPVIRNAEKLSIGQLDDEIRALAEVSRSGAATPAQLTGSNFTLNNYGTFGVDGGAPIINHPEVAILGIGRMIERPWVVDGQIVPRRIAQVSLVFDHRVCDGGYATGFLRAVVDAMENPLRLYREL